MDTKDLNRVRYFKGQLLTAHDFEDQQEYHSQKLKLLLRRFPSGVVRGLEVTKGKNDNDEEGILISTGFAVDAKGNILNLSEQGVAFDPQNALLKIDSQGLFIPNDAIPLSETGPKYLNLTFAQNKFCAQHSICENVNKFNRILETVQLNWSDKANPDDETVTIAAITKESGNDIKVTQNGLFRIDAGIIEEANVTFDDISGHDHTGGGNKGTQIPHAGIADNAIETNNLATGAVDTKNIKEGAVTLEKIGADVTVPPNGNAGGDLDGTYPNPVIGSGKVTQDKIDSSVTLPPSGPAGGDLSGDYPNPGIGDGKVTQSKIHDSVTLPPSGLAGGSLTGHYPNPTIGEDAITQVHIHPSVTVKPSGPAGGDLTGNYPYPSIGPGKVKQNNIDTNVTLPPSGTASGDLTGNYPGPSIAPSAIKQTHIDPNVTVRPSGAAEGDLTGNYPAPSIATGAIKQNHIDSEVSLPPNGSAGGALSGNYPDPGIATGAVNQNHIAAGVVLPPSGTAGGDLTGEYPNPSIAEGVVTGEMVNFLDRKNEKRGGFDGETHRVTFNYPQEVIVQFHVIPMSAGSLRWGVASDVVSKDAKGVTYTVTLQKIKPINGAIEYCIRPILLGAYDIPKLVNNEL